MTGTEGCVIVTGGARRMGGVIARRLVADGYRVIIHHRQSATDAEAIVAEFGSAAIAIDQDLSINGAERALIADARAAFGVPVTGLVNNASLFEHDFPPLADGNAIERHMRVNLTAPVLLASAMAEQRDLRAGVIVNILDQKLANLNPDFFSYTCSKMALAGATRMLAQGFAPRIRVNAVAPGLTLPSLDQTDAEFAAVAGINLLQRPVGADQVAGAVAFLLVAQAITGQTLFVDAGQRFLPSGRDVMFSTREAING
ncbi:SDR family NAD(P)-dependent oxidoreductase [Sphingomonas sp. 28-63-12]|uniref:SDR family NAD(P)-dependent oxidoreductase n=1 Tax=Sphingomonas sp. 28-63-12 TaxID=1970434 RepID=UPI000BDB1225|nr:MAG: short-chain dehydrogenase [Sphingomonas sp. 28-63-12]